MFLVPPPVWLNDGQYEDENMEPTEELFNVGKDRLEMKNLVNERSKELKKMRKLYDKHFAELVRNSVSFNTYKKYEVLFDRDSDAEAKRPYLIGTYKR